MPVNAVITNISRGSLHDGPGVRTVVYFKGCGMRCRWCHNPETLSAQKQILYAPSKCIHCGKCAEVCPGHHKIVGNDMVFLREGCTACGRCAQVCPALALNLCGEEKTVDELFDEIKKDTHYFVASGGGVTFSGGECLLHADFVRLLAEKCKQSGIHTVIESAFFVPWENVEKVLPYIDLFFADLKIADSEKHRKFTRQDNSLIIDNIRALSQKQTQIILRIPVIPGVNDLPEDIAGFAKLIKTFSSGVREIELLKYNHLAESKYAIAGRGYTKFADSCQTNEEMKTLCDALAEQSGVKCYSV